MDHGSITGKSSAAKYAQPFAPRVAAWSGDWSVHTSRRVTRTQIRNGTSIHYARSTMHMRANWKYRIDAHSSPRTKMRLAKSSCAGVIVKRRSVVTARKAEFAVCLPVSLHHTMRGVQIYYSPDVARFSALLGQGGGVPVEPDPVTRPVRARVLPVPGHDTRGSLRKGVWLRNRRSRLTNRPAGHSARRARFNDTGGRSAHQSNLTRVWAPPGQPD